MSGIAWKYGRAGEYAHIGPFKILITRAGSFWTYVITDRRDPTQSLTGGSYQTGEDAKRDGVAYIDSLAD
jgi:hypothetical protein